MDQREGKERKKMERVTEPSSPPHLPLLLLKAGEVNAPTILVVVRREREKKFIGWMWGNEERHANPKGKRRGKGPPEEGCASVPKG